MTYWFIMGTAAELIKMYPILVGAIERKKNWYLWSTGQGADNFWNQYDDFELPRDRAFNLDDKAADLNSSWQALRWFARNIVQSPRTLRRRIEEKVGRCPQPGDMCFVHGDTLSTLMGAVFTRRLGCSLAHIEAGMRSGSIWSPFPEELNRRTVSRLTHFHFAPDDHAARHLRREKQKGEIIVTAGNSVYDALYATLKTNRPSDLPQGKYVVANLHRFENLHSQERWKKLIDTTVTAAKMHPVYFVMHPPTQAKLEADPGSRRRLEDHGVHLLGRLSYKRFIHLMAGATFVLTDGGSNQTECAYLGLPCLILRDRVEFQEGLGINCILSRLEDSMIQDFLSNPERYRAQKPVLNQSPSQLVFAYLDKIGR